MLFDNWKECWEYANYCDGRVWRVGVNYLADCEDIYYVAHKFTSIDKHDCQSWSQRVLSV